MWVQHGSDTAHPQNSRYQLGLSEHLWEVLLQTDKAVCATGEGGEICAGTWSAGLSALLRELASSNHGRGMERLQCGRWSVQPHEKHEKYRSGGPEPVF